MVDGIGLVQPAFVGGTFLQATRKPSAARGMLSSQVDTSSCAASHSLKEVYVAFQKKDKKIITASSHFFGDVGFDGTLEGRAKSGPGGCREERRGRLMRRGSLRYSGSGRK